MVSYHLKVFSTFFVPLHTRRRWVTTSLKRKYKSTTTENVAHYFFAFIQHTTEKNLGTLQLIIVDCKQKHTPTIEITYTREHYWFAIIWSNVLNEIKMSSYCANIAKLILLQCCYLQSYHSIKRRIFRNWWKLTHSWRRKECVV